MECSTNNLNQTISWVTVIRERSVHYESTKLTHCIIFILLLQIEK